MTTITAPMQRHHKHCDDLFANAEATVASGDWTQAESFMAFFHADLEAHFCAEEEILFPAFEAATGMRGGPTQMMRLEHQQMRDLVRGMNESLASRDRQAFAGAAETLLILMQQHNMKEENILYPMCDRSLANEIATLGPTLNERLDAACLTAN